MIIHFDNQNQKSQSIPAELFKYKLASAIIPKERWKPDDDAKQCAHCEKGFIYLIRRKHHCRRCGQVFCAEYQLNNHFFISCSENYIQGIFFSPDSDKFVRFCVKCYDQLTRYLKKHGVDWQVPAGSSNVISLPLSNEDDKFDKSETPPSQISGGGSMNLSPEKRQEQNLQKSQHNEQQQPTNSRSMEEIIELQNDEQFNPDIEDQVNIQALFVDDEQTLPFSLSDAPVKVPMSKSDQKIDDLVSYGLELKDKSLQKIDQLCEFLGKRYGIYEEWGDIMSLFIKKAVEDVNIDSITTSGDPMDINYYVKIKKIPYLDKSVTGYFKGVVFRKNVTHKRMQTKFTNPKLMIIVGNLEVDEGQGQQSFENLVNNERKNIRKIVEKISKYHPDLLLVEKGVNRFATELFVQYGISVVQNIQPHILRKIAKCTRAKYIKLDRVEKYQPEKVLGHGSNLIFRTFNAEIIVQNKEVYDSLSEINKELLTQYLKENKVSQKIIRYSLGKRHNSNVFGVELWVKWSNNNTQWSINRLIKINKKEYYGNFKVGPTLSSGKRTNHNGIEIKTQTYLVTHQGLTQPIELLYWRPVKIYL